MLSGQQQANYIGVWTKLEQARELVASCRSSTVFPSRPFGQTMDDIDMAAITCDKITMQIADLRNWVYTQMGQT